MLLREMLERVRVEVRAANMGVKLRLMSVVEGGRAGGAEIVRGVGEAVRSGQPRLGRGDRVLGQVERYE